MIEELLQKKQLEYSSGQTGKIEAMIVHLLDIIQKLKRKTANRISRNRSRRSRINETLQNTFIVTMDNYFTLPNVMAKLRQIEIGVVGTSRFRWN